MHRHQNYVGDCRCFRKYHFKGKFNVSVLKDQTILDALKDIDKDPPHSFVAAAHKFYLHHKVTKGSVVMDVLCLEDEKKLLKDIF